MKVNSFKHFYQSIRNTDAYDELISRKERNEIEIPSRTYLCMYYIGCRLNDGWKAYQILPDLPKDLKWVLKETLRTRLKPTKIVIDWSDANYELKRAIDFNCNLEDSEALFLEYPFRK